MAPLKLLAVKDVFQMRFCLSICLLFALTKPADRHGKSDVNMSAFYTMLGTLGSHTLSEEGATLQGQRIRVGSVLAKP